MGHILRSMAVIALAAFAASCAKEQTAVPLGEETTVSFSIAAPVIQTRAIADGKTVDKVACYVYDSEGALVKGTETYPISQTIDMTGGAAKFSVRLVTGQKYSFIFWAYKAPGEGGASPYTLSEDGKTVTVSYEGAASNDESRDAFYTYVEPVQITGSFSQSVELSRPFAQVNFGVEKADIEAAKAADANFDASKSKVKLTGLGNTLDLTTGEVTGEVDATFALAERPTEDLTVNSTEYGYVAMNYVLVGKDKQSLTDATLWIADSSDNLIKADGLEVTNVPIRGNYRTNIVGNLFTSQVITNINVDADFEEDIVKVIDVDKVSTANDFIEQNKDADVIELKFTADPDDAAEVAILTTPVKEDGILSFEVEKNVGTLYVGDYASATVSEEMAISSDAKSATVNITIPEGVKIDELIINASTKHVNINGVAASSYTGTQIGKLTATTSANTLVIAKGQTVDELVFNQGGLEIHGTVNAVTIPDDHGEILVRECENLSGDVYEALESYIAEGYEGYKTGYEEEAKWNIADTKTPVKLDGVGYDSLQEAIDAFVASENEIFTISLVDDIVSDDDITFPAAGKILNLDANGHKISFNKEGGKIYITGGTVYIVDWQIYGQVHVTGGTTYMGSSYVKN